MKLIYTEAEWRQYCHENGWKIVECSCCNNPDCTRTDKLCYILNAVDDDNIIQASFKCYASYGKVFLNSHF